MVEEQPAEEIYTIESAPNSDTGKKRTNNEDWVAGFEPINPKELQASGSLYIVADGVGGASKGEEASQFAAKKVLFDFFQDQTIPPKQRLQRSIRKACKEIFEYSQESNLSRMATTMVAANVRGNKLTVANVGDSRCYLIRSGKVTQITQDHNFVGELVRNGSLSPEAAKQAKVRNTLMRSLGGEADVEVDIFGEFDLYPGDIILLCSDGLTRYAEDADILRICSRGSAERISEQLIEFANERGGADNTSVYVIKINPEGTRIIDDEAQTIPEPVSWDSIKLRKQTGKYRTPKAMTSSRSKFTRAILLALILLTVVSGTYYFFSREKTATSQPVPLPTAGPTEAPSPTATMDLTPTAIVAAYPILPFENTPTLLAPTLPTAESSTPTATFIPIDLSRYVCVHVVQSGEFISTILSNFSQVFDPSKSYWTTHCNFDEKLCNGREEITSPNNINQGLNLLIYDVNQSECLAQGNSYWMIINP